MQANVRKRCKTRSKWIILAMAGLLSLALSLAACAPAPAAPEPAEPAPAVEAPKPPEPAQEKATTTIEFWHVHPETFGGPAIHQLVEEFNRNNPDIQVVEKFQPNMYLGLTQNLHAAVAAKRPPAVTQLGNNWVEYGVRNFPHVPVEDMLKGEKDAAKFLASVPPEILNIGRVDGKLATMIWSLSNPVLYYNADMFRQAGLDPNKPPRTWDEVRSYARTIKEKTGNLGIYIQEPADFWAQQAMIESNGGRLLEMRDGRWVAAFDSPEAIEAFQLYAEMVLKDKSALHAPWDQGMAAFVGGQAGMAITTIARLNYVQTNAAFEVATAPFPTFGDKTRRVPGGGNVLMITAADPQQQEAAWRFIKYLMSPGALTTWIEGTGYVPYHVGLADNPKYLKPFIDATPGIRAAIEQVEDTVPWVNFPGRNAMQIEQVLVDTRAVILTGEKEPAVALKEAAAKVNELLP